MAAASSSSTAQAGSSTSLFAPFRSLGHISTGVPFVLQTHSTKDASVYGRRDDVEGGGKDEGGGVVVTSVGRGWAMWTVDRMRLLLVGARILSAHSKTLSGFAELFLCDVQVRRHRCRSPR